MTNSGSKSFASGDFKLEYDSELFRVESVKLRNALANEGAVYSVNTDIAGIAKVSYASVEPVSSYFLMDFVLTVIAERYFTDPAAAVLAYAQGFPDGLCGGPLAMNMGAPLILTSNESPTAADDYIEGITVGVVTGGTGRITDDTVRAIFDLAEDTEIPIP